MTSNDSNWVICLGGNSKQIPYIKEIKKLGYRVLLIDKNRKAPGIKFADLHESIGYDEVDKLNHFIDSLSISVEKIFTASSQFAHHTASIIANKLNIFYPDEKKIYSCLDKNSFYKIFDELGLPIPPTRLIRNRDELNIFHSSLQNIDNWYLKSDFGKSPYYIYKFNKDDFSENKIFWGKDRYLRNCYVLQPEVIGLHLRINIFGDHFCAFYHHNNNYIDDVDLIGKLRKKSIVYKLKDVNNYFGFNNMLCKYDVILGDDKWYLLDIGIDPPSRMLQTYSERDIDFYHFYIKQSLFNTFEYPLCYEI